MEMNGIGVYLTELGNGPVLVSEDHEVVLGTPDHRYGWTRDGEPNTPDTRRDHGAIRFKLYDLVEPDDPVKTWVPPEPHEPIQTSLTPEQIRSWEDQ